ncbi:hypothetical protein Tco_0210917 [Tanacetum coccineum]
MQSVNGSLVNQRTVTVLGPRGNSLETPVSAKDSGITCFNSQGFGHYAGKCKEKPKRSWVKDTSIYKEKMRCANKLNKVFHFRGFEQADWLVGGRSHLRNQVLLIRHWNRVDQNATECVDERAALANLIANLTLDNEENKTFLKQLKKANASLTQNEGVAN